MSIGNLNPNQFQGNAGISYGGYLGATIASSFANRGEDAPLPNRFDKGAGETKGSTRPVSTRKNPSSPHEDHPRIKV